METEDQKPQMHLTGKVLEITPVRYIGARQSARVTALIEVNGGKWRPMCCNIWAEKIPYVEVGMTYKFSLEIVASPCANGYMPQVSAWRIEKI